MQAKAAINKSTLFHLPMRQPAHSCAGASKTVSGRLADGWEVIGNSQSSPLSIAKKSASSKWLVRARRRLWLSVSIIQKSGTKMTKSKFPTRVSTLFFLAGFFTAAFPPNAAAGSTHSIDWYLGHPVALRNAIGQCNIENGLIGGHDCRNAFMAVRIIAGRQGPAQLVKQPAVGQ